MVRPVRKSLRTSTVKGKQNKSPKKPSSKENGKAKETQNSSSVPTTVVTNIVKETPKANKSVNCRKCDKILLECDDITSREEHSISCDSCHHWFHRGCTVLTDVEFDFLQDCNEAILFKCQNCLETKGAEYKSFSHIESKLNEMMIVMSEMKTQILKEVEDKIDYKLKETQQQEKMESAIRIELKQRLDEKGITLRPRPVQIVLPNPNSKNGILKNSRNLRDSKYQQISVRPDLTRKQQEIDYKLRQQLRQRKDKKEDVIIYKGEIIQRVDHPNYKPSHIEDLPTNAH